MSYSISQDEKDNYISELCAIEELMNMYNFIVSIYRKLGNSQQSRECVKTIFMSFEIYVVSIIKKYENDFNKYLRTIKKELITAISFYEIIERRLSKGVTVDITREELINKSQQFNNEVKYSSNITQILVS